MSLSMPVSRSLVSNLRTFWVCMVLLSPSYVSLRLVIYQSSYLRRPRTWNIVKFQNKQEKKNKATEFLVSTDCRYKEKRLLVFLMWRLLLCQKIDWCQHCCRTKYAADWMFTDVYTAAEQSMLLTGCLLMSTLLQNKVCCWLDVYRCLHCCRTKHAADWMFTDV